MPSQSVAGRQNAWKRIKKRYHKHTGQWYARREARKLEKQRKIAANKARARARI